MTEDNEAKAYISLATEEYRTLREESKQASINMWTAMQWGSALIGVSVGVGLSQWSASNPATALAFDVVVPVFACLMMLFWLGEAARFKRAGDYLCLLEGKLSLILRSTNQVPATLSSVWPEMQRRAEADLNMLPVAAGSDSELVVAAPLAWEQWLRVTRGRSVIDATCRSCTPCVWVSSWFSPGVP
jgi:hypothetical protein